MEQMTHTAQAHGLEQHQVSQLQIAFASLLVAHATECWIKEIAAPKILHEKLTQSEPDVWLYLRNHINDLPEAFSQHWQLNRTQLHAQLHSAAAKQLQGIFSTMLEDRDPSSILYDRWDNILGKIG